MAILSDDGKSHWDPYAPNANGGNGAWVPGGGEDPTATQQNFTIPQNPSNPTSEAAARYRGMGQTGGPTTPVIDQTASNESRGIGMGALDLLKKTAEGSSPSQAEQLGTQQGQAAQQAQMGIAASVRGGAAARAGAARGAVANAGTIGQQTAASNEALRAGEMASARDAYFGAATGQRKNDLGLAGSQADLESQNRGLHDQREGFYEGLANDTKRQNVNNQQGVLEGNMANANAANQANETERAREHQQDWDYLNMGVGAAKGLAGGASPGAPPTPGTPKPDTTSDERAKDHMKPVSSRLKARSRSLEEDPVSDDPNGQPGDPLNGYIPREGEKGPSYGGPRKGPLTNEDAGSLGGFKREIGGVVPLSESPGQERHWDQDVSLAKTVPITNGASLSGPVPRYSTSAQAPAESKAERPTRKMTSEELSREADRMLAAHKVQSDAQLGAGPSVGGRVKERIEDNVREDSKPSPELQEAMRKAVEKEAGPPERKMNPENPYTNSLFGHAEPGYAKNRSGQPGGMFGVDGANTDNAPGTEDFYAGSREPSDPYSRKIMGLPPKKMAKVGQQDIMVSDQRAKQQAFEDGANWSLNNGQGGVPKYMPGTVNSQGGAKRAESPVRGKDSTSQAAIEEYPMDRSQRSPEDRAKVAQLLQFLNDNEGDAFDRANVPGQGPPAAPLNPREGTDMQGVPRTSVANDMRKRTREYATSQDRDETPEQRTARFLKKSQDRKAQEKGAESAPSSPPIPAESESANERTQRFMKKSQDTSRPGAPAKWDTSSNVTTSDKNTKVEVRFGGPMAAANRSMKPSVYEYKPEFAEREHQPVGDKNVGPMAQNMDKDPVASTVIVHDPQTGLMGIDKAKGLKLVMGGLSDLQRQVDELHGKKKGDSHGR